MTRTHLGRRGLIAAAGIVLAAPRAFAAGVKPRVRIETGFGVIKVELEAERAPLTSANFLRYVDAKKYDGGSFFRAAKVHGAPGQGSIVGGPSPKTHPFPPIAHESTTKTGLRHKAGTISLGRFAPGSATADFFICASDEPYLDAHPGAKGDNLGYAAFGHVLQGMGVVHRILAAPTSKTSAFADQKNEWLKPPIPILTMRRA